MRRVKKGIPTVENRLTIFAKTVVIFVCVELIIVVGAIIGVNKTACNAVHKLEALCQKA